MDYLAILCSHLDFIERFFHTLAFPLEVKKGQIERGEPPFEPKGPPEDYDGPEHEMEWNDADDFLRILGQCSLGLLEKALHDYLRAFVEREGKPIKSTGNWFKNYSDWLEEHTGFRWANSPVAYGQLEQLNLSRNAFAHDHKLGQIRTKQSPPHYKRYLKTQFAEESVVAYYAASGDDIGEPWTLNVTSKVLAVNIEAVKQFCTYVEGLRRAF